MYAEVSKFWILGVKTLGGFIVERTFTLGYFLARRVEFKNGVCASQDAVVGGTILQRSCSVGSI